jgi:hypothetical protein
VVWHSQAEQGTEIIKMKLEIINIKWKNGECFIKLKLGEKFVGERKSNATIEDKIFKRLAWEFNNKDKILAQHKKYYWENRKKFQAYNQRPEVKAKKREREVRLRELINRQHREAKLRKKLQEEMKTKHSHGVVRKGGA